MFVSGEYFTIHKMSNGDMSSTASEEVILERLTAVLFIRSPEPKARR